MCRAEHIHDFGGVVVVAHTHVVSQRVKLAGMVVGGESGGLAGAGAGYTASGCVYDAFK